MPTNFFELSPAYGRDYSTGKAVLAAFHEDLDFIGDYQLGFQLVNKSQLPRPCSVILRYKANRATVAVVVK